jgi:HK97 family phage major capsid protein
MSTNENLKRIVDLRNQAFADMKATNDAAEAEGRSMTADEQARFDKASGDMDALKVRADRIIATERAERETADLIERHLGTDAHRTPEGQGSDPLTRFLKGESRTLDIQAPAVGLRALVAEARKAPHLRDLTKLSAGAGGNLVPTTLYGQIVQHLVDTSGVIQAGATIINTSGGEPLDIPKTTSHGAAALVTEGNGIAESDPVFGKVTLGAFKYGQLAQLSIELLNDSAFDVVPYVADSTGRNVGLALGTALAVGAGTTVPRGITIDSTLGKTGSASVAGAFSADDLVDLMFSVGPQYRVSPQCAWLMRDATIGAVRKLKEGTTNQYIFQTAATVGAPDTLLGKPIYSDPNIAAVGLAAKSVVFGDISRYFVRIAGGVRFERSDEFAFNADLVTFRTVIRADGALVDLTGAVKHFIGNAA